MPFLGWRRLRKALLVLTGCVLAAWLIPPFFHAGRYRHLLQSELESRLGRPVKLGAVTYRLLPHPGFSIENLVIGEDPQFGGEPFARVESAECDLPWRSLWGSQLNCARIMLDNPSVEIVRDADGQWNLESLLGVGRANTKPSARHSFAAKPQDLVLEVQNARVNFILSDVQKPFVLSQVQAQVEFNGTQRSARFDFRGIPERTDLVSPPPGMVEVSGDWNMGGFFQAEISTQRSLLLGWIPMLTGHDPAIYGLVDANLDVVGSSRHVNVRGHIRLDELHRRMSLPPSSSMPLDVNLAGSWNQARHQLAIHKFDADFAGSHLHLIGVVSGLPAKPKLNLVAAVDHSRLENFLALGSRLLGRTAPLSVAGRLDGLLTVRGAWKARRYGGFLTARGVTVQERAMRVSIPEASVRVDRTGAHLLPVRFHPVTGVECVARGELSPALPDSTPQRPTRGHFVPRARYRLSITSDRASLHGLILLARALRVQSVRDLDMRGRAAASIHLSGRAWPFTRPQLAGQADVYDGSLLVPGFTKPIHVTRLHVLAASGKVLASPVDVRVGQTAFFGWIMHSGPRGTPWTFDAHTARLSLEQSSLWFTVLGHRPSFDILSYIPGLSSFAARRTTFASVNARGTFETREMSFRTLRLHDLTTAVSIARRVARISNVSFSVAGGEGRGQARVDFARAPALVTGQFRLAGLKLHQVAGRLPRELHGLTGSLSAAGNFSARGLTTGEMGSSLRAQARVRLTRVSFGAFDPLRAVTKAAMLTSLDHYRRDGVRSIRLDLKVERRRITLSSARMVLPGGILNLSGDCDFNGMTNLYVKAELQPVVSRFASPASPKPPYQQTLTLHLAGLINKLAVVRRVESARMLPRRP